MQGIGSFPSHIFKTIESLAVSYCEQEQTATGHPHAYAISRLLPDNLLLFAVERTYQ